MRHGHSYGFLIFGGSLGSYLPISLENEFLKISHSWVGHFKEMPAIFISDFDIMWTIDVQKKKMEKWGCFQKPEKYRYHIS